MRTTKLVSVLHPPLTFSAKPIGVTVQERFKNGIIPKGIATPQSSLREEIPVSVLMHHFDRCFVENIVRLKEHALNNWTLSPAGLDNPEAHPWFLVCGVKDQIIGGSGARISEYLIVNADFEFYPVVYCPQTGATPDRFMYEWCHLLRKEYYDNVAYTYSEIDKMLVESAIQSFLRENSWAT